MNVLLVEPDYYTQYPPLGLLKLSAFYKRRGDSVQFVRGNVLLTGFRPDIIDVTSLFTWAWKPVWDSIAFYKALFPKAHVRLGGVYASLAPEHARGCAADEVVTGIIPALEDVLPDYSIVPEWHSTQKASILFTHRGCVRTCSFCAVPKLEGKPFQARKKKRIRHLIHPDHNKVILWDNNILGEEHWPDVLAEIKELDLEADFNQGLDARYLTEEVATALQGVRMSAVRVAYDYPGMGKAVQRAIERLASVGVRKRSIMSYVLFNYTDTPEDLFQRVRDLLNWGISAYPMRYQPLNGEGAFDKDSHIAAAWTRDELNMVAKARRVIGYGGAFPPYEGLRNKFNNAKNFHEAFELYPERKRSEALPTATMANLAGMGRDHQYPTHSVAIAEKPKAKRTPMATERQKPLSIPLPFEQAVAGLLKVNPKGIPKPKVAVTAAKKTATKKKAVKKAAKKKPAK